ncbi:MAG: hypothetical protein LE168_01895, partial [Endomicrobium sp.]|nr:hypothetical protein [Endomicrobium sp.]
AVKLEIIYDIIGIARAQFFRLLKQYRQNELSLSYKRTSVKLSYPKPFISKKTSFLYDLTDIANGYRITSLKILNLKVNGLNPYDDIEIRLYKLNDE